MAQAAQMIVNEISTPLRVDHDKKRRQFTIRLNGKFCIYGGGIDRLSQMRPPCFLFLLFPQSRVNDALNKTYNYVLVFSAVNCVRFNSLAFKYYFLDSSLEMTVS